MNDLLVAYRACGADCHDDYLRRVVNKNGRALAMAGLAAARATVRSRLGCGLRRSAVGD